MTIENPLLQLIQPLPEFPITRRSTALLVVDMQYFDAHPDFGVFAKARDLGLETVFKYYFDRLQLIVPNIARLQAAFRQAGMEVIHTKIESLTKDGRERSLGHKHKNIFAPRDSKEGAILKELEPLDNEIVLSKTASGVFNSTAIDQILRNLGIDTLVVTGVVTNNCVENAVRAACDLSYKVILVEDGCAAVKEDLHQAAVRAMNDHFAKVKSADDVLAQL